MNKVKLSVITVCYNEKEIERTCRSIAGQKCQNFEWIVIDGGSTDGTLEILQRYKGRIDKLVSEPDKGVFDAMNKGIKLAHGEWLNFMNGGDLFANDEVVGEFLRREANADGAGVIYADFHVVYDDGQRRLRTFDGQPLDKRFFYGDCIGHQASFIRRELFDKYGLYNDVHRIVRRMNFLSGEKTEAVVQILPVFHGPFRRVIPPVVRDRHEIKPHLTVAGCNVLRCFAPVRTGGMHMKVSLERTKPVEVRTQGVDVEADFFLVFDNPCVRIAESRKLEKIQQNTVLLLSGEVRFDEKGVALPFDRDVFAFPVDRLCGGAVREKPAHGKEADLDPVRRGQFRMTEPGGDADG